MTSAHFGTRIFLWLCEVLSTYIPTSHKIPQREQSNMNVDFYTVTGIAHWYMRVLTSRATLQRLKCLGGYGNPAIYYVIPQTTNTTLCALQPP